jgi:predicted nucleic acid-binding protein
VFTCSPVVMEVTAGATDDEHAFELRELLADARTIQVHAWHFEDAAAIHRMCRKEGITVRSMIDCLIASVALSEDVEVLHHDRDFNAIARVVPLRIHPESLAG